MTKEMERLKEIEGRKSELAKELDGEVDEKRMGEIHTEAENLKTEEESLRSLIATKASLAPGATIVGGNTPEATRAAGEDETREKMLDEVRRSGHLTIRNNVFTEKRTVTVASGKIATPTAAATEIGELPTAISSIVDDVYIIDATGTGSWEFPYRATDAEAADATEGTDIAGTPGTFDKVTIAPEYVGVFDEISNQVKKMSSAGYALSVQNAAYLALRRKAKAIITSAVKASTISENLYSIALDQDFIRTISLGFGGDETLAGGTKLYINKTDLSTLGKIRGTQDKKPVFDISYTDENNGMIKDGGLAVPFSLNSSLATGEQLYGQPQAVKMLMWGDYEVLTDEGGEFFKRNVMAVRGTTTANAGLAVYHGMQVIHQAAKT